MKISFLELYEALIIKCPAPKAICLIDDDEIEEDNYCECCGRSYDD